jgi:hypothetical protein
MRAGKRGAASVLHQEVPAMWCSPGGVRQENERIVTQGSPSPLACLQVSTSGGARLLMFLMEDCIPNSL